MPSHVKTATAILNATGPAASTSASSTYHGRVRPNLNIGRPFRLSPSAHAAPSAAQDSMDCGVTMQEV